MDFIFGKNDRKRKADDVDEEEGNNEQDVKRQLFDNTVNSATEQSSEIQPSDTVQQQEQQPSTENGASNEPIEPSQEALEETNGQREPTEKEDQGTEQSDDNKEDVEGVVASSEENHQQAGEVAASSSATPSKVKTVVPFDRLIVLTVSATCDENSASIPGSMQVTKENSEVIGKQTNLWFFSM